MACTAIQTLSIISSVCAIKDRLEQIVSFVLQPQDVSAEFVLKQDFSLGDSRFPSDDAVDVATMMFERPCMCLSSVPHLLFQFVIFRL